MSNELVVKKFEGIDVFFMESGWFNATEVAKKFGKRVQHWLDLPYTQELITKLLQKVKAAIPAFEQNQLVIVKRGSPENGGGTWMHPKLAVHFAYWLDVDFGVWVGEEIEEIFKRINFHGRKSQFQVNLHPILHFPVVGHREDALMKQTRNTYTAVLDSLGFAAAIYKRVLTNNVSRILIGMEVKPFRRLHGIPAGSRRRTRLYYDYNLRRAMDEIEDIACVDILSERPQSFEEIEKIVYQVARTIYQYASVCKVNLLEHVPQHEIDYLLEEIV